MSENIPENGEFEEEIKEKSPKKSKKSKKKANKVLLADFLSKGYMLDKSKCILYIAKKTKFGFQFVSSEPFKPPLNDQIFSQYGEGIYKIEIKDKKTGKAIFPNTVYIYYQNGEAREISVNEIENLEKNEVPQPVQPQGIVITPEAMKELIEAIKTNNQNPQPNIDLSPILETFKQTFKTISEFQAEMMKKTMETQMEMLKNMIEPEEEEEEEIDQEELIAAINEGKWEIVDEILTSALGEDIGKRLSKLIKFGEAYIEAKKLQEQTQEIKQEEQNE
jgi:hypothetical protein